jgi:acyl-CoA reductase-like NAD-dependent aldehyde dehydrogenase
MSTTTSQQARLEELKNFVNGQFAATAVGRASDIIDPSTGEAYARAPVSGLADVDAALRCAEAAREGWRDTTPAQNTHIPFASEMPHGGFKHSGYGKDLSMYGFEDYTRVKHLMSYFGG